MPMVMERSVGLAPLGVGQRDGGEAVRAAAHKRSALEEVVNAEARRGLRTLVRGIKGFQSSPQNSNSPRPRPQ